MIISQDKPVIFMKTFPKNYSYWHLFFLNSLYCIFDVQLYSPTYFVLWCQAAGSSPRPHQGWGWGGEVGSRQAPDSGPGSLPQVQGHHLELLPRTEPSLRDLFMTTVPFSPPHINTNAQSQIILTSNTPFNSNIQTWEHTVSPPRPPSLEDLGSAWHEVNV